MMGTYRTCLRRSSGTAHNGGEVYRFLLAGFNPCGSYWTRTSDSLIKSQVLYRLS